MTKLSSHPPLHPAAHVAFLAGLSLALACGAPQGTTDAGGGPDADGGHTQDAGTDSAPTLLATTPTNGATAVVLNSHLSATFNTPMESASLSASTFLR